MGAMRPYVQRIRAEGRERTATAIERATVRELRLSGFTGLRMADVARRAGVALRTVYLHAPTKEVLVLTALRRRAATLARRVERWRPSSTSPGGIIDDLVRIHERTYRSDRQLLELLVASGTPGAAEVLDALDGVRLALIERTMAGLGSAGALRTRAEDAIALAHLLLAYPTWRAALTGPARRRAPRVIVDALRATLLR